MARVQLLPRIFGERRRGRVVLALGLLTLAVGAAALPSLNTMSDHGVGILELEFVRTSAKAQQYYGELGSDGRSAARTSLYLDYPYLLCYGLFLATACVAVASRARRSGWARVAAAGPLIACGALLAATFDAAENAAVLLILAGHTNQPYPGLATACASAKFALATVAGLYALLGWLATLRRSKVSAPGY
jgi:hypothetical protein